MTFFSAEIKVQKSQKDLYTSFELVFLRRKVVSFFVVNVRDRLSTLSRSLFSFFLA